MTTKQCPAVERNIENSLSMECIEVAKIIEENATLQAEWERERVKKAIDNWFRVFASLVENNEEPVVLAVPNFNDGTDERLYFTANGEFFKLKEKLYRELGIEQEEKEK